MSLLYKTANFFTGVAASVVHALSWQGVVIGVLAISLYYSERNASPTPQKPRNIKEGRQMYEPVYNPADQFA